MFNVEGYQALGKEIEKLLEARFIEKVNYLNYLANVLLVKKSNKKWRMCEDFTNLNNACLKDSFSLFKND